MTRPTPTFRPRGGAPRRKLGPIPVPGNGRIILGVLALAVIAVAGGITALVLTGGGSDAKTDAPGSTGGTLGGPQPMLAQPIQRFSVQLGDLPPGYQVNPTETFGLNALAFATKGPFKSVQDAQNLLDRWGYLDGLEASFVPDGQLAGVVKGGYYVQAEVYLFNNLDGARNAYQAFEDFYRDTNGSERLTVQGLGNQSSAWQIIQGTVGTTDLAGVYHRFVFRRGNMVAVVQTYGGQPYVTVDKARDLAVIIDDKALGQRPAPTPTPNTTSTPGAGG